MGLECLPRSIPLPDPDMIIIVQRLQHQKRIRVLLILLHPLCHLRQLLQHLCALPRLRRDTRDIEDIALLHIGCLVFVPSHILEMREVQAGGHRGEDLG